MKYGLPDKLGVLLGCDVGQFDTEGNSEGWLLGILELEDQ